MAIGAGAVGALAWPFIDQMNPAGDTLALASIEFDLTKVAPGQQVTVTQEEAVALMEKGLAEKNAGTVILEK